MCVCVCVWSYSHIFTILSILPQGICFGKSWLQNQNIYTVNLEQVNFGCIGPKNTTKASWPSYFWGTAVSLKIVSGLKTNWINVRHWLFFGSKNLFKSFRFLNLSYFSVLRYRAVVPSFIGSAKEGKPLPPYLLECFFPTVDFNIQPHLILIFSLR